MKTLIKLLALSFLMINAVWVNAQQDIDYHMKQDSAEYQIQLDKYQALKKTSNYLIGIGVPVIAVGVITFTTGVLLTTDSWNVNATIVACGLFLVISGGALSITGIVYRRYVNQRTREYQSKLDNLKVGTYFTPNQAGITLTYRF